MTDWTCRRCQDGLRYDEERKCYVCCDCPTGQAKRRWLNMSLEERRLEKKQRGRKKKKQHDEDLPGWVTE